MRDTSTRAWLCLIPAVAVFALAMAERLAGSPLHGSLGPRATAWAQFALCTPVVLWGGGPFFACAWAALRKRRSNMFTLLAMGIGVSYAYSTAALAFPGLFPPVFYDTPGRLPLYFEVAAVITVLVLWGQVLELRARARARSAIRALLNLTPATARRVAPDGSEHDVPVADLAAGDLVHVRPEERLPVDGIVARGTGLVDESTLSGQPIPVEKRPGRWVTAGTVNGTGSLVIRTERVGRNTLLAHIVDVITAAQCSRAPIQRLADVVAAYFVPFVLACALLTFVLWSTTGPAPNPAHAILNAVSVLVVACPWALGLAAPLSIMVGIGRGATEGILIRDAEALQALEKVDTLVLDKTGILTAGTPRLTTIASARGFSESDVLRLAASLELASDHPLAAAIVAGARERQIDLQAATDFRTRPGSGVSGRVDGHEVSLGNRTLLAEWGDAASGDLGEQAEVIRRYGHSVVLIGVDGRPAGLLGVSDPIKASTPEAITLLHADGTRIVMLTGDDRTTAEAVAARLGIDDFEADVLPARKREIVKRLQEQGQKVAMAGDGVTDATALAQADVGIAMGTGTGVAVASTAITLVRGDLHAIARARHLSRETMRNIRQNLSFTFLYNMLSIPVAAGALYALCGFVLNPTIAATAMTLCSLSVIANALRLRKSAL